MEAFNIGGLVGGGVIATAVIALGLYARNSKRK